MRRLDGRDPAAGGPALAARNRFGSSRLAATVLFALAAAMAVRLHFEAFPPGEHLDIKPWYLGAALCGAVGGWRVLGLGLGRGTLATATLALTAAAAALLAFCVLAGLKAVVDTYSYGSFDTVMALVDFLLLRAATTGEAALASPALYLIGGAAVVIGPLCDILHRVWDETETPGT